MQTEIKKHKTINVTISMWEDGDHSFYDYSPLDWSRAIRLIADGAIVEARVHERELVVTTV